jgi:hypothetical protein
MSSHVYPESGEEESVRVVKDYKVLALVSFIAGALRAVNWEEVISKFERVLLQLGGVIILFLWILQAIIAKYQALFKG